MLENTNILRTSVARSTHSPDAEIAGEDPAYSFATALAAIRDQAAAKLEVHGAAPAETVVNPSDKRQGDKVSVDASQHRTSASRQQSQETADRASSSLYSSVDEPHALQETVSQRPAPPIAAPTEPAAGAIASLTTATATLAPQNQAAPRGDQANRINPSALDGAKSTAPARQTAPQSPATAHSFAEILAKRINSGATSFEIRLDPPDLGKIEANMKVSASGDTVVALKFENQTTLDLYARDSSLLQSLLSDAGGDTARRQLTFELIDPGLAVNVAAIDSRPALSGGHYASNASSVLDIIA